LALLIPGVVDTHVDNLSNSNGASFSVNGERGRANNFEIAGQANNDTTITRPQIFFGNDEVLAELQVITNSFSTQYDRNAGSVGQPPFKELRSARKTTNAEEQR
jgi:hypothetical protein